jgi:hypothetical protein
MDLDKGPLAPEERPSSKTLQFVVDFKCRFHNNSVCERNRVLIQHLISTGE